MTWLRSARYLARVAGQSVGFAAHHRQGMLLLVIILAPLILLISLLVGLASPLVVYPFL